MSRPMATERRPVPRIDPRIRARRIAVRRKEGRRRLHWLGAAGVVVAAVAMVVGVALSPLLDVDAVHVAGVERADRTAVLAATGIEPGDPLATLDLGAATAGVQALPWVAEASVSRAFPGTVEVAVVERVPGAGIVQSDGRVALVDVEGHVLELVDAQGAGVVLVDGLLADLQPGQVVGGAALPAIALAAGIPGDLEERVLRILVTPDGRLDLELVVEEDDPPAVVRFGEGSELVAKLRAFVTMVSSADLSDLAVLDLEVPEAPALTRR